MCNFIHLVYEPGNKFRAAVSFAQIHNLGVLFNELKRYPAGRVMVGQEIFFFYIKNSVAESHGVLGHYCVFDIVNTSTEKINLFTVESEVMKSYP